MPCGVALTKRFTRAVPEGDTRQRHVCGHCGFIAYENPRVVVGSVAHLGEAAPPFANPPGQTGPMSL